jgi:L-lactate dehydrogenase (cytochrome)
MDLDYPYPAISDLADKARRRLPHFMWEFLDSGTGDETTRARNAAKLDDVRLASGILEGKRSIDLETELLGRTYSAPVGIAPVGMSGGVWPGAEAMLARLAVKERLPYCLSTVTAATPEDVGPHVGEQGWFQLYPPGDVDIRRDLLKRAKDAGFHTLVLTVDVATASRRERQRRAMLTQPMRITPRTFLQAAIRPAWSMGVLQHGMPKLRTLAKYGDIDNPRPGTAHIGYLLRTAPDWEYLAALRDDWDGPLVIKGLMDPGPVKRLLAAGVDALWVSNHGGRQFDASPAAIEVLPAIRAEAGPDVPVIFDSGIRSGTDVLRAVALGADFVMLGRAWHYGLAALGEPGAAHVLHILRESLAADMGQMAITRPVEARKRLIAPVSD